MIQREQFKKTSESTSDLIGNKTSDKIIKTSKNNSKTAKNLEIRNIKRKI